MEIKFEKDYLRELFYDGAASDKQHRFQPDIVRRYVRVVNIMDSVDRVTDLFLYRSLHYEKLLGDKKGIESVRANDQYRIEFKSSESEGITICNITELAMLLCCGVDGNHQARQHNTYHNACSFLHNSITIRYVEVEATSFIKMEKHRRLYANKII